MSYYPIIHDNRLTDAAPTGFVYLARTRQDAVCGRIGYGPHRDDPRPLAIWACRETPDDFRIDSFERVLTYLKRAFPHLRKNGRARS
jgi:hypothetical protein